jgi:predicted nucleotide-binding protein
MKIAVSFDRDTGGPFYEALIKRLQTRETAVYANNLTHFFPEGPKDFGNYTRLNDALRHPDLIIVLLSTEYLGSHWLRSEVDAFLRLENARGDEKLVLIVPTGTIEDSQIPYFYRNSIVESLRLRNSDGQELDAIAKYIQKSRESRKGVRSNRVFIVHGHEHVAKAELELFLKEIGLDPIVLHRQIDKGLTIIEKFEKYSCVDYAIVLLTPDDSVSTGKEGDTGYTEFRARQNVIFELGFFIGKLGRERVCCIYKRGVTPPSDTSGIVYKEYREHVDDVKWEIIKELRGAGYRV